MKYKHINIDSYFFLLAETKGSGENKMRDSPCLGVYPEISNAHGVYAKRKGKNKIEKNKTKTGASRIIVRPTTSSVGIPHLGKTTTELQNLETIPLSPA